MIEKIQVVMKEVAEKFSDTREQLLELEVQSLEGNKLKLHGRALDDATLAALRDALQLALPELALDTASVCVLRKPGNTILTVNTNLTGFFNAPSFLAESLSEQMYGWQLEVLEEKDNWCFVRQEDGYMGWVYKPYMREGAPVEPTHVAMTPVVQLRAEPRADAMPIGRLLGGVSVAVLSVEGEWAMVDCDHPGWVPLAGLRAFSDIPQAEDEPSGSCSEGCCADAWRALLMGWLLGQWHLTALVWRSYCNRWVGHHHPPGCWHAVRRRQAD